MRDTELLRLSLQGALACLPLLVGACGDGSASTEASANKGPAKSGETAAARGPGKADPAPVPGAAASDPGPGAAPDPAAVPPVGDPEMAAAPPGMGGELPKGWAFDYYGPPRDPYEDHDEEEGCPNGDWCGAPEDAALFEVHGVERVLACPARLLANPEVDIKDKKARKWQGFSFDGRMQGRLVTTVTEETRAKKKNPNLCCYHWFEYCSGRPLLDDDDAIVASARVGDGWSSPAELVGGPAPDLPVALRQRLAREWLADALMEHASIASFARATLELLAVGAPPELLAEVQAAALDEVRHAGRCFALAARYAGRDSEPGPLPALPPRPAGLARLAVDTFREGCVGETGAALLAGRQARACRDPAVRSTLQMIADDESRHAALAWRTLEWAIARGGAPVAAAVRDAALALRPRPEARPCGVAEPQLREHGRADAELRSAAQLDAWREIIDPTLAGLLAASPAAVC